MKKSILFFLSMFLVTSLFAQTTIWNPAANDPSDGLWTTAANWTNGLPAAAGTDGAKAVFNVTDAMACTVDAAVSVQQIVQGDGNVGDTIIVANGGSITTGVVWTGIGYNNTATLIIESGGSFTFGQHAWIGMNNGGVGTIQVHGTMTVSAQTGLGWSGGTGFVTVHEGGVMNCAQFNAISGNASIKEGSILDIRGGTVNFTGDKVTTINEYIEAGRIIGYSGGGTLNVSLESGTTVVTANADDTAPTVVSTFPTEGATDMPGAAPVQIEFSEKMDEASVEGAITTDIANPVYSWSGNTLSIQGDEMTALQSYNVTIGTGAMDYNGIALEAEFSLSFTIVDPNAPPTVVSTDPAHNATGVAIEPSISMVFSKAMDSTTVVDNLNLSELVTTDTAWSADYKTLTITCGKLAWETTYNYTFGTGSEGADGTVTTADSTFSFTTVAQPKTEIAWEPADDGSSDGLWTTADNWDLGEVADGNYVVKFNKGDLPACTLDAEVNINQLIMGVDGVGDTLIIANGGSITTRNEQWSGIGRNNTATLIVEEGGSLTVTGHHFWIGMDAGGDANVHLNGGTITVGQMFGLGFQQNGTYDTLFLNSGLLNLTQLHPDQSVGANSQIVIGDGMIRVRGNHVTVVNDYIAAGKIVMSGDVGGLLVYHGGAIDSTYILVDKTAPTVAEVAPANGSTGIALDSVITITFSEPMHRANTEGAITVSPELTGMYFMWMGNDLTVAGDPMANETEYTVTIGTGATDVSGNALETAYPFSFTTVAAPTYTVTFNVSDADGAVADAAVTFQSNTANTDASGQAVFTGVAAVTDAAYTITKDGYEDASGTVTVSDADVTENVTLTALVSGLSGSFADVAKVYPNPASTNLTIEFSSDVEKLEIINVLGKVVYSRSDLTASETLRIDVSEYSNGMYFVTLENKGNKNIQKVFVK